MLVARYPVVSAGLRYLLSPHRALRVVGDSTSVSEAVALMQRERADVALIDPDGGEVGLGGVSALAEATESRVLVFTAATDPRVYARAIELGAAGVVSKDQPASVLVLAIQKVHAGELWLDRARMATVLSHAMRRGRDPEALKIESLTKREREIVTLVGEGLRNTAIAARLFISEATVRNHLTSILSKLELADRFDLAVYAFRHNLVANPDTVMVLSRAQTAAEDRPPRHEAADRARGWPRVHRRRATE